MHTRWQAFFSLRWCANAFFFRVCALGAKPGPAAALLRARPIDAAAPRVDFD